MGTDIRLERLTKRTYRVGLEREGAVEAGKRSSSMVPTRMRVADISRFATGAQRRVRSAARPTEHGRA